MGVRKYVLTLEFSDGSSVKAGEFLVSDGDPGTSVYVSSVTESTEDGGYNIVRFSDGTILSIKNGKTGNPFALAMTYSSVEEMNSKYSTDDIPIGSFVAIETGNVEDEDNAKVYVKGKTSYEFLMDLSGTQGLTGPIGPQGKDGTPGKDGADGSRGPGILKVTGEPTTYTTETAGKTPIKRMAISTIKAQSGVGEVVVGDLVLHSFYLYHIYNFDANYAYIDTYVSIRGAVGAAGADGTSVTVTDISESSEDGGNNVVYFSDGKTLTVKNGQTGQAGSDGTTFTPNISEDCDLSWENDGGKENPPTVNIKGDQGERGTGVLNVTTEPTAYTTETAGVVPVKKMAISTIKAQSGAGEVLVGDLISHSFYHYHIYYLDATYAYMDTYKSIRGATGAAGSNGKDGKNGADGADGKDYVLTEADKTAIANITKGLFNTETWTFKLKDGSTVTKKVVLD